MLWIATRYVRTTGPQMERNDRQLPEREASDAKLMSMIPIARLTAVSRCASESLAVSRLSPGVESSNTNSHAVFTACSSKKFLTLPDSGALVDMGEGQDLIGRSATRAVRAGPEGSRLSSRTSHCLRHWRKFDVSCPCAIGGVLGIIQALIDEDVLHIL